MFEWLFECEVDVDAVAGVGGIGICSYCRKLAALRSDVAGEVIEAGVPGECALGLPFKRDAIFGGEKAADGNAVGGDSSSLCNEKGPSPTEEAMPLDV